MFPLGLYIKCILSIRTPKYFKYDSRSIPLVNRARQAMMQPDSNKQQVEFYSLLTRELHMSVLALSALVCPSSV